MSDKKASQKIFNVFHRIMKALVSKKATIAAEKICLYCESPMKLIETPTKTGIVMVSKYECPNGHTVEVTERI